MNITAPVLDPPTSTCPELVVLGHIARDYIHGNIRLGGAAGFASRAAAAMGISTGLVTVAPDDPALLTPLAEYAHLMVARRNGETPSTFELDYSGPTRRIYVRARAETLRPTDVPDIYKHAPVAYICPVIAECRADLVGFLQSETIVVGAQGWLRRPDSTGLLVPYAYPEALELPCGVTAVVFSELDHPDAISIAKQMSMRAEAVAVTRGASGATVFVRGHGVEIPADKAEEVDPTGAGDVFGLVMGLALHRGVSATEAACAGARAAARVVEGPGLGSLSRYHAPLHIDDAAHAHMGHPESESESESERNAAVDGLS